MGSGLKKKFTSRVLRLKHWVGKLKSRKGTRRMEPVEDRYTVGNSEISETGLGMLGGTINSTQLGYVSIAIILGIVSLYVIYFANGCM